MSQMIAMVGTVFLFLYWPSFNAVLASGLAQERSVVNTLISITASTLVACYISRCYRGGKVDMEVMLNSTLAGGVIMGAACDFIYNPGYAMICGSVAGGVSAIGFL
jgi:ammonium transporter Rh